MTDIVRFDEPEEKPNIIKVMGVGGGGSNAVTHMFTAGITGVDFILCNTDDQALQKSPVENKLHIGDHALGAGNVPAVGRQAAEQTEEGIREALADDTKMLFITAGMGGGTGTGAAPVVARISRELGILTVGIVTLPFSFEGKRRQQQAAEGIAELRKHVDALLVISNDKLREEYGDMKLTEAFKKADDVLMIAAKGIAEIITVTGYVNVDFEDVNNVMRSSGKAIMGSGDGAGENRHMIAVEQAVNSPLLADNDITGAKNILVYITSSTEHEVTLDEVTEINEYVQDATGKVAEIIWGNGVDEALGENIRVTIIATGFGDVKEEKPEPVVHTFADNKIKDPEKELERQQIMVIEPAEEPEQKTVEPEPESETPRVKRHTLYEDDENTQVTDKEEDKDADLDNNDSGIYVKRITHDDVRPVDTPSQPIKRFDNPFTSDDDDVDVPGFRNLSDNQTVMAAKVETKPAPAKQLDQKEILRRQRFMSFNTDFRNMSNLENFENIPAYARMGVNITNDDNEMSRYSVNKETGLREENSYLHTDVD